MARAVITIEDRDEGGISVQIEFDPPLATRSDDAVESPAQVAAFTAIEIMAAGTAAEIE